MTKICNLCFCEQSLSEFGVRTSGRVEHYCRGCKSEKDKDYRRRNGEKIQCRQHQWYVAHKDHVLDKNKIWADRYPDRVRQHKQKWDLANREKRCESARKRAALPEEKERKRQWARANPKDNTRYTRERAKRDVGFRVLRNLRNSVWRVIRRGHKSQATLALLGCGTPTLLAHLERQFQPGMTWGNYGKWHIDHVRPCASFDLTRPEQQKQCFRWSNLQPLWAEDNLRKHAKVDDISR